MVVVNVGYAGGLVEQLLCTMQRQFQLSTQLCNDALLSVTSTAFNYYTALLETSKTHFYGPRSGLIEF